MSETDCVAVVRIGNSYHWYRCDRDVWVLDWNKWRQSYLDAGIDVPRLDPSARCGIAVVNERTVNSFLAAHERYQISTESLRDELLSRFESAASWWDVGDLFPIIFVDCDHRHVCAFYPDGTPLERHIPDGWTGEFEDFATLYGEDRFPRSQKFWIVDDVDMLAELNRRGEQLDSDL